MRKALALLIIRNPGCYPAARVNEAAVFVLGSLDSRPEDLAQAAVVIRAPERAQQENAR